MVSKTLETSVLEFTQAVGLLVRRIRAATGRDQLSLSELMVMACLSKDGPATTADLARAEGVKPQSMGTIVATLEASGFVERIPHPTDGRQMMIQLTAEGVALRKRYTEAKQAWLVHAIIQLDESERATLFAAGEIIRRLVEGE